MKTGYGIYVIALLCLTAESAAAQTAAARIVKAANTFVATLDDKQRQRVQFAWNDEEQRKRWSNLPVRMVQRAGLSMGELNPSQRSAAMDLLASALSRRGLEKVQQIME